MESEVSQKIRLGLFVIIGLLIFLVTIYLIGSEQSMFGNTSNIKAIFKDANGLQLGNNVRYAGINAGTVKEIEMINDTTINVTMRIDEEIFKNIKKNAVATISSDGLVGNMIVSIVPGNKNAANLADNGIIATKNKMSVDAMLATLNKTNLNAALLSVDLLKISKEILRGKGAIGTMISDTVIANDLKGTMKNLNKTTKGAAATAENLNKLVVALNNDNNVVGVLKDSMMGNKIKKIVSNFDATSSNLNKTILNLKDGKGALNYLSNDPSLVKKIDSTMFHVNQASVKLNENLEALKSNWFFRGGIKKMEKKKLEAKQGIISK